MDYCDELYYLSLFACGGLAGLVAFLRPEDAMIPWTWKTLRLLIVAILAPGLMSVAIAPLLEWQGMIPDVCAVGFNPWIGRSIAIIVGFQQLTAWDIVSRLMGKIPFAKILKLLTEADNDK